MLRIRRLSDPAATYPVRVAATDEDGSPVTVGSPVVRVYDGAGAKVGQDGTPAAAAGEMTWTVPAGTFTELDAYRLVWSGDSSGPVEFVQEVELCEGHLFEIADLRAFDPAFADATRYTGPLCRSARAAAEERFEKACRQAFVGRGRRVRLRSEGNSRLRVADNAVRRLVAGSVDGVPLTAAEVAETVVREWGAFDRPAGKVWPLGSLVGLHYEHGAPGPTPEISQAVMLLAREYLVRSSLSSRATVEATDVGFFRVSVAAPDRPTGLPEVDAVIRAVGRSRPLVG